jgi:hypothetical protein
MKANPPAHAPVRARACVAASVASSAHSGVYPIVKELRAGLQDPTILRLYDYWDAKRGARFAPRRQEIDPLDFPYALADIALAEVLEGPPLAFRYRLVGENLVRRDGYNMRGRLLAELPEPEYRERVRVAWTQVVETRQPRHTFFSAALDGRPRRYESLVLPIAADGDDVAYILGIQRHSVR